MVPFEFASILLLVAMIVVLMSKRKTREMNNILNEIGIENYILLNTLYWVFEYCTVEMLSSYLCQSKLC
jgi:hypothetical protein